MKESRNTERIAKGSAAALAAMLLLGAAGPVRALDRLSPALDIIAADFTMAKTGLVGTDVYFSKEDFAKSLGVDSVKKITVTSLPDSTLGRLQLGGNYVYEGQTISARNLDKLKFIAYGSGECEAVFRFTPDSDAYGVSYDCTVYTLKTVNTAPEIKNSTAVGAVSDEITAFSGIAHLGTIFASDAEDDPLTFEIVRAPSNGSVRLTDASRGYYEYTADEDFTGKDSFTVRVTDKYGNRSAETKLTLRVEAAGENEVFADMDGHWANAAAVTCAKAGVVDASDSCLYPDEYVSRAEFLSLMMRAAGYSGFSVNTTGFADDASIPTEYRGYVAAAEALGVIDGIESAEGLVFCPNNQITRSEAAVIVSRLTGITGDGTVSVFADSDAIPAWASGAMHGLAEAGILRGSGGALDAYASVTRGAAMQLAASVIRLK